MSVFANEGKDVLVNYNYMLRVEGIYDLPCKAVHSFTKENEFEYVQEGGLNDYVHMLRKPISKPFTFTVERYVGTDLYPILPLGAELILPVILMVSPHANRFDVSKRTFVFTGCTVMGKTYGELNAEKSGLLTETIVIGYREMLEVSIPVHTGEDIQKWAFKDKEVKGNNIRSATRYTRSNADETAEQRKWAFDKKKVKGKGTRSAARYERSEEDEKAEQRKWSINPKAAVKNDKGEVTTPAEVSAKSAKRLTASKAEQRKWAFDKKKVKGKGTRSAARYERSEEDEKAEQRKWSINPKAAVKNDKGEVTTPAEVSAKSAKRLTASKAEQRKWSITDEEGTQSAKTLKASKAIQRKWSINPKAAETNEQGEVTTPAETSAKSAKSLKQTQAKQRRWRINPKAAVKNDEGEEITPAETSTKSAVTLTASKAKQRKWPAISSAKKLSPVTEKTEN